MKNRWFAPAALVAALLVLIGCIALISHVRNSASKFVAEVNVNNFEDEVLKSPLPVYIEFYVRSNCKACEAQAPIVEKLAQEYAGKVRFVRVEARQNMELAIAAGVQGVPTHFFLKPAEGLGAFAEGFLDEPALRKFLDDGLALTQPVAPPPPADDNDPSDPAAPADESKPAAPADESKPAAPADESKPAAPADESKPAAPADESKPAAPADESTKK